MHESNNFLKSHSALGNDFAFMKDTLDRISACVEPHDPASVQSAIDSLVRFIEERSISTPDSPIFAKLKRDLPERERVTEALVRGLIEKIERKKHGLP